MVVRQEPRELHRSTPRHHNAEANHSSPSAVHCLMSHACPRPLMMHHLKHWWLHQSNPHPSLLTPHSLEMCNLVSHTPGSSVAHLHNSTKVHRDQRDQKRPERHQRVSVLSCHCLRSIITNRHTTLLNSSHGFRYDLLQVRSTASNVELTRGRQLQKI